MVYCYAKLPSAGLANRLFVWARCLVFSRKNNIPMIATDWAQIKIGPILRGEKDKRFYWGLFRKNPEEIDGARKILALRFLKKIPESNFTGETLDKNQTGYLVIFSGYQRFFASLNGHSELIKNDLLGIVREKWIRRMGVFKELPPIGIHVRRGDFRDPQSPEDLILSGGLRTPIEWYFECLDIIRKTTKKCVKAFVVSDGSDSEIESLLRKEGISLVRTGSAITDLLVLSKAKILIGAGGSSFSAWASFLGQMVTISPPGQSFKWFNLENQRGRFVDVFDPNEPSTDFIEQARDILINK